MPHVCSGGGKGAEGPTDRRALRPRFVGDCVTLREQSRRCYRWTRGTFALEVAGPATADITPSRDAGAIAQAIADPLAPGVLTSASFQTIPPAPSNTPECSDGLDNDGDGKIDTGAGGDPGCPNAADNREQEDAPPECSDGEDNDGDGKTDFAGGDAGCSSAADLDEGSEGQSLVAECSDGLDNDFDGQTDFSGGDPGCAGSSDNREEDDRQPQCSDGFDNDGDGATDFAGADPGCDSAQDDEEEDDFPNPAPECSDGFDNDDDGQTDFGFDVGCSSIADVDEFSEGDPIPSTPECSDGEDNDLDGLTDFAGADPGCFSSSDNREEDDAVAQCSDGEDNDFDDDTDLADPGCDSATDNDEGSDGLPPGEDPNPTAIVDSSLAGLPFSGPTWGMLTSGNSTFADDPNSSGSTGQSNGGGDGGHGPSFHDVVTLRVNLAVPANVNCLSVDFRFLSDEFPEFVGDSVNDAFVAELDVSDFSADSTQNNRVVAPHNFAFDGQGNVISINTTGATEMSAAAAAGTTYDGATPRLRAFTPITPGVHALYLSIFDQGDSIYDSAVFLDNLVLFATPAGSCGTGATPLPPDTTITAGPSGTTTDDTPTFEFTATEAGSTFECRLDAGDWLPCTTPHTTAPLAAGEHTFYVRARGPAGGVDPTPASRTFTVDGAPDTAITSGPSGPTSANTPTFEFSSTEGGSAFERKLDDAADWTPCPSPHTAAALADGPHTIEVRAKDGAGNADPTPASGSFTVDTTPPDTVITSGPAGPTSDSTPTFEFNAPGEPGATFECKIDDAVDWTACPPPHTTAVLSDGQHTFQVRAKDGAGNMDQTPASRTFTVDTAPPDTVITSGPAGPTTDSTPTFEFTATEAGSTLECSLDGGAWFACSSGHTTGALADGQHTFQVRARDAVGNLDPTPASRTFTVNTVTPPPGPSCDGQPATKVGTAGKDKIVGTNGRDVIVALGGRDKISGKRGNDVICAGGGDDKVAAGDGDDVVKGEDGNDGLRGGSGDDDISGGDGADSIWGDRGDDDLSGGAGRDRVKGGAGADEARGEDGNDGLFGNTGNDQLFGAEGRDKLSGGPGNDHLDGGPQRDRCRGGSGTNQRVSCES
jgi:RTX calcium-binding nonapeptide repeat (4 copies)